MKAIMQDVYGGPEVLELREVDQPAVTDDDVLVRVRAASVNPLDWHFMRGEPFVARMALGLRKPKEMFRGVDMAGHVEAVGKNVTMFKPGDEVFGTGRGSFANYACAREDNLAPKPSGLTFEQAAAVPVAGCTALMALRDVGRVRAGQRVLINGAAGGVGTFAVQIAKALGAVVTGVCSTSNVDMVRSIGADHVIDYSREDFARSGERHDLILDNAGRALSDCRRALTSDGTLVLNSGSAGVLRRLLAARMLSPFVRQRLLTFLAKINRENLVALSGLIESGKVTPVIDRTFPLSEAAEAIRYLEQGHARGKVVITV